MIKNYYFYSKIDSAREPIGRTRVNGRLKAAQVFSAMKQMSLKQFLEIYSVSR